MYNCVVVGDVMMDVVLRSDYTIFKSLRVEGTNYFPECKITPGGSGNLSAAISWLGGRSAFIGKAGNDQYGRAYHEDLRSYGVTSRILYDRSASTGLVVSLVESNGKRTMLVSRGANDKLTPSDVKKSLRRLGRTNFVYLSGYSLVESPQREAILEAASIARKINSNVVFDPGSSNLIQDQSHVFEVAVEKCDILCANLKETKTLAGEKNLREYLQMICKGGKVAVVKMGQGGCLIAAGRTVKKIPGVHAESVDTTGAGDAFLGALLYCLASKHTLVASATFANWFASRKTEGLGPRYFPSKKEASQCLKNLPAVRR